MSILIKDMKMPSVCDECWALDESGDYPMCRITEETRGYNFRVREKRMDRCPLVGLPDHGDLVSIEAAKKEIDRFIGYLDEDMIVRIKIALSKLPAVV